MLNLIRWVTHLFSNAKRSGHLNNEMAASFNIRLKIMQLLLKTLRIFETLAALPFS